MTALRTPAALAGWAGAARPAALAVGLALAASVRWLLNGTSVGSGLVAGAFFAGLLVWLSGVRLRTLHRPSPATVALGIAGGVLLVALPLIVHPLRPMGMRPEPFVAWALVTTAVAVAEEAVLRGTLFSMLQESHGAALALIATTVAFALIHVPLYGWSVVPIDLAAGLVLGGLRLMTGSASAPAISHVIADLATWWL